jgi:hypothetical protein
MVLDYRFLKLVKVKLSLAQVLLITVTQTCSHFTGVVSDIPAHLEVSSSK